MSNQSFTTRAARRLAAALLFTATPAIAQQMETVHDIKAQFASIDYHGDPIGWNLGVADNPSLCKHYQGVVRYNDPAGVPYLFVTRSGNKTDSCPFDNSYPGELVVVRMGSRPTHGDRMRSNKWAKGKKPNKTVPDSADKAVKSFHFDTSGSSPDWPDLVPALGPNVIYHHPGSPQILGDVLAIPLEEPGSGSALTDTRVLFVDISDPENPVPLYSKPNPSQTGKFGSLGMVRMPDDGTVLFALVNSSDAKKMTFARSTSNSATGTDLKMPDWSFGNPAGWDKANNLIGGHWADNRQWQTTHLFVGDDGGIYLACADQEGKDNNGDDYIALFRGTNYGTYAGQPNLFDLQYVWQRHLKLNSGGKDMGNLNAASGFYVSPMGSLLFYSCEHDNDGEGASVKMGEFRSDGHDLNDPSGGPFDQREFQNPASCGGWVEMYEKKKGWKTNDVGNSWIFDYEDRNADDWDDFGDLDCNRQTVIGVPVPGTENCFGDNVSSVRWNLPYGRMVRLYKDDNYNGKYMQLEGRGEIIDLSNSPFPWNDGSYDDLEDEFSSIRFLQHGNGVDGIIVKPFGTVIDVGYGPIPAQSWSNALGRYGVKNGVLMMACEDASSASAGLGSNRLLIYPGSYGEAASTLQSGSFIISQPMRIERYNPSNALPPTATVVIGGF